MKVTVRRCVQCGRDDARRMWSSMDEAADAGALRAWVCPTCAWPEAELVEIEAPTGDTSADPLAPADDARHAVAGSRRGD